MMRAQITGVADTAVGNLPGSSCMGLHTEAAALALEDAGLTAGDIDGVLCAYSFTEPHLMLASVFCKSSASSRHTPRRSSRAGPRAASR